MKRTHSKLLLLSASLGLSLATPALAGGGAPIKPKPTACVNIADWLGRSPQFSTLSAALQNSGHEAELRSGTYTVFAPTNSAFNKLPSDQLAAVLSDQEALQHLLQNHALSGKYSVKELVGLRNIKNMDEQVLTFGGAAPHITVNGAQVSQADIQACNGNIEVIDTVLLPAPAVSEAQTVTEAAPTPNAPATETVETPAAATTVTTTQTTMTTTDTATTDMGTTDADAADTDSVGNEINTTTDIDTTDTAATDTAATDEQSTTVYDLIENDDRFSTLRSLLSDSGLSEDLSSGSYTLFAPTDDAFDKLNADQLAQIASDPMLLKQVLNYHLVKNLLSTESMKKSQSVDTASGATLTITSDGNNTQVGNAKVLDSKTARNGAVYVIDTVLLPPDLKLLPNP